MFRATTGRYFAAATVVFLCFWVVIGRSAPTGAFANAGSSAGDLGSARGLPAAFDFHGSMTQGGVAFGEVAVPARDGLQVTALAYDPALPDGQRLVVSLDTPEGELSVSADLPDWHLVPLALYAAGDGHALFTLFGTLEDPAEEAALRAAGYSIMNFAPVLKSTLLGLRTFHADVLVLTPASADLPRVGSEYILGTGEAPPDVTAQQNALAALQLEIDQPFQSYLINDYQKAVTFDTQGDALVLTGDPYWRFWRFLVSEAEVQSLFDAAADMAFAQVNAEFAADALVLTTAELDAKYTDEYVQRRQEDIIDEILTPQVIEPLIEMSDRVSARTDLLGAVNPAVYTALQRTMRFRRSSVTCARRLLLPSTLC